MQLLDAMSHTYLPRDVKRNFGMLQVGPETEAGAGVLVMGGAMSQTYLPRGQAGAEDG
jgi:hypothetical protein